MIILETEHLLFRPLTITDLDDMTTLYSDPEVMRFLGGPRSRSQVQLALNRYIQEYQIYGHSFFATLLKENQKFIGHCGLLNQEVEGQPEIELAYVLAQPYWQHGLALEGTQALRDYGLQQLGFPRLISLIPADNQASIHIAEKIGMQYERDIEQWGQSFGLYVVKQPQHANA
ncbi:N-acetyltransferase [Ktedonosporobacter rubrisoli]|uniref:N-acetyltransferase n=1 Tax=Ktedonosporobacter rubrisoli TaxID=2509675 RepID=A0A4V0YYK3_KTERU|nr:GNAT family N-acetyltransferase [Ktedonosporobacter rubrisoli]QBD76521.1 N-acetyltransferase [Ktedonosporobacter rubrisoli]